MVTAWILLIKGFKASFTSILPYQDPMLEYLDYCQSYARFSVKFTHFSVDRAVLRPQNLRTQQSSGHRARQRLLFCENWIELTKYRMYDSNERTKPNLAPQPSERSSTYLKTHKSQALKHCSISLGSKFCGQDRTRTEGFKAALMASSTDARREFGQKRGKFQTKPDWEICVRGRYGKEEGMCSIRDP